MFGATVASMFSGEQPAIETTTSMNMLGRAKLIIVMDFKEGTFF